MICPLLVSIKIDINEKKGENIMKMKKKRIMAALLALSLSVVPFNFASAANTLKEVKSYEVQGEKFEVETWVTETGKEMHTVSSNVQNKEAVAEFVNNLYEDEPLITPMATFNWAKNEEARATNNSNAYIGWNISGYRELPLLVGGLKKIAVNTGTLRAEWFGDTRPDKIQLGYSYEFKGLNFSISLPTGGELTQIKDTVSWKSLPISNVWFISTKSEKAEASSLLGVHEANFKAGADFYKGSFIYRPQVGFQIRNIEAD